MGRRRKRKIHTPSPQGQVNQAFHDLSQILSLKREHRHRKRDARRRVVTAIGPGQWKVAGGECEHIVSQRDGQLTCDHEPHTRPSIEFACAHEIAVRRFLCAQLLEAEVAA